MSKLFAIESSIETMLDILTSDISSRLKQQALMFDSIGITHLDKLINAAEIFGLESNEKLSQSIAELKWLSENGIVFEPSIPSKNLKSMLITNLGRSYAIEYGEANNDIAKLLKERRRTQRTKQRPNDLILAAARKDAIILRLISATMNKAGESPTITTLAETDYTYEIANAQKRDTIQVVVNKLPLPDAMTPWEKIIDFRNDEDNRRNLLGLRNWIRKISTEEISKAEIEDEIEWRINEFQQHMKYHKIKANTETLEVLVKAPLEIIENIVKLKLSKIPEPFFAVKKRQLTLMEAELNAPSKELAYIIKSRESFQPQE